MGRDSIARVLGGLIIGLVLCASVTQNNAAAGAFPGSFSTSLAISGAFASAIGTDTARISWSTSDIASSQVFYDIAAHGDIAAYSFHSNLDSNPVLQHAVTLAGLQDSTVYHFRAVSAISVRGAQFTVFSEDLAFETAVSSGTGGSGDNYQVDPGQFVSSTPLTVNSAGVSLTTTRLTVGDSRASLLIAAGTRMLDSHGQPLRSLSLAVAGGMLPTSPDPIISFLDFGPEGATFVPPMTISLAYSSQTLADGISEDTLYIAFWNGSGWQKLAGTVDTQSMTVSASCSQSGLFALMGKKQADTTTPTTTPAAAPSPTPTAQATSTHTPQPPITPASQATSTPTSQPSPMPKPKTSPTPPYPPAGSSPSNPSSPIVPATNGHLLSWLVAAVLVVVMALSLWWSRPYGWRHG